MGRGERMKRSEAEKRINDWLDQAEVITGKTILDFMKELGMVPPEMEDKIADNDNGCEDEGYRTILVNKWEEDI